MVGDRVRVGLGQFLAKPPAGTLWHRPSDSDTFTLQAEVLPPVLEIGDVVGLRDGAPIPLAPDGCDLIRIYDAEVPEARKAEAAILFKVVGPPAVHAYATMPKPTLPGAVALDTRIPTSPPKGRRWMPFLVDGRDLRRIFSVPVPQAIPVAA